MAECPLEELKRSLGHPHSERIAGDPERAALRGMSAVVERTCPALPVTSDVHARKLVRFRPVRNTLRSQPDPPAVCTARRATD